MKNRITAIIGAGVPLGFDSPNEKPSTSFITETVKKPYKDYHTQLPIKIVEEIYQRMKTQLPPDVNPWANTNEPYVHFDAVSCHGNVFIILPRDSLKMFQSRHLSCLCSVYYTSTTIRY